MRMRILNRHRCHHLTATNTTSTAAASSIEGRVAEHFELIEDGVDGLVEDHAERHCARRPERCTDAVVEREASDRDPRLAR